MAEDWPKPVHPVVLRPEGYEIFRLSKKRVMVLPWASFQWPLFWKSVCVKFTTALVVIKRLAVDKSARTWVLSDHISRVNVWIQEAGRLT